MGDDTAGTAPRAADLPPGFDKQDPYENEDLSTYPEWWRRRIEEFQRHDMRPYRPARFEDGKLVPAFVWKLETELDVEIDLRAIDPSIGDDWMVEVDGERVATVARERTGNGYTEYALTSGAFVGLVEGAAGCE